MCDDSKLREGAGRGGKGGGGVTPATRQPHHREEPSHFVSRSGPQSAVADAEATDAAASAASAAATTACVLQAPCCGGLGCLTSDRYDRVFLSSPSSLYLFLTYSPTYSLCIPRSRRRRRFSLTMCACMRVCVRASFFSPSLPPFAIFTYIFIISI